MIWCCGMYSSGSTWLYNAARAAGAATGARLEAVYADRFRKLLTLRKPGVTYVVKTHDLDAPAARLLTARADRILLSIRDPRDAVLSMTQHMGEDFTAALEHVARSALFVASLAANRRAILLRYESGFIDDPATFDILAAAFNGALTPSQRGALFAASRRDVIEAKIATLHSLPTTITNAASGDVLDTDTQWHRHHANRTGEIGRWKTALPPDAVRAIEARLADWMKAFGYPAAPTCFATSNEP